MANNPVNVRRVRAVASFLLWVASPLVPIVGGFYEPGISLLVVPLSFVFLALLSSAV